MVKFIYLVNWHGPAGKKTITLLGKVFNVISITGSVNELHLLQLPLCNGNPYTDRPIKGYQDILSTINNTGNMNNIAMSN